MDTNIEKREFNRFCFFEKSVVLLYESMLRNEIK